MTSELYLAIAYFAIVLVAAVLGGLFGLITHLGLGGGESEAEGPEEATQPGQPQERRSA